MQVTGGQRAGPASGVTTCRQTSKFRWSPAGFTGPPGTGAERKGRGGYGWERTGLGRAPHPLRHRSGTAKARQPEAHEFHFPKDQPQTAVFRAEALALKATLAYTVKGPPGSPHTHCSGSAYRFKTRQDRIRAGFWSGDFPVTLLAGIILKIITLKGARFKMSSRITLL